MVPNASFQVSSQMKLLVIVLFVAFINGFTLPKIFKNGMVLQSEPTHAVIWGFLGENKNPVTLEGNCKLKTKNITLSQTYSPIQVI